MEQKIHNPYLPGKWYIPDGEPHIFNGRIYLYGSHDEFGSDNYCTGPYAGWSASVEDPGNWKYEGIILEKGQDPLDPDGTKCYYAPDIAEGPDGRYYLYYSIEGSSIISVAVSDSPAGKFCFYGHVRDRSGHVLGSSEGDYFQFDPAVLTDDDGKIWLYSGQGMPVPEMDGRKVMGALVCELDKDMVTAVTNQKVLTSHAENCFTENPFFEASSIRKIGGVYYFIYSPIPAVHNLCYAVSQHPDRGFHYQGILVSNGGIVEIEAGSAPVPEYYWGNNHGSILELNGEYFIFYHRHTNRSAWCRQGCVERLKEENGRFLQSPLTSLGMRETPFLFSGTYDAYTACILNQKNMKPYVPYHFLKFTADDPYITQEPGTSIPYIANIKDGSKAGYRYFNPYTHSMSEIRSVTVAVRGSACGTLILSGRKNGILAEIPIQPGKSWTEFSASVLQCGEKDTLTFCYHGEGCLDFLRFRFE